MLEKLGARKYLIPFIAPFLLVCLFGLMFYPMANMQMKNMPFAVVNLDQGVDLPTGHVNAGDEIAENITSGSALSGNADTSTALSSDAISWTVITSQEEFDQAKADNQYFGYIVIPDGFTLKQAVAQLQSSDSSSDASSTADAAAAAAADPSAAAAAQAQAQAMQELISKADALGDVSLEVQIDKAKSPMAAMQIQSAFSTMLASSGLYAQVSIINDDGYEDSNTTAYGTMMSLQLSMMPTIMGSLIAAILLSRIFNRKHAEDKKDVAKRIGMQVAFGLGASLVVALCCWCAVAWVAGLSMPFANAVGFLWLASFCMILFFGGCFNVNLGLGIVAAICIMGLGNMTGVLPSQMLPDFWANWVCPWAPQAYVGLGIRMVSYMGAGVWNAASPYLLGYGAAGLALLGISYALPLKANKQEG